MREYTAKVGSANTKSKNNRIYTTKCFNDAVNDFNKRLKAEPILGHLDHDLSNDAYIRLNYVSHEITKLWMNKNTVFCDIKILKTRAGNDVMALLDENIPLYLSMLCEIKKQELIEEKIRFEKIKLITIDIVQEPAFDKTRLIRKG